MSNQHTKGYSKNLVEAYQRIDLKHAGTDYLRKHYEHQGYIRAVIGHTEIPGVTFTVTLYLDRIKAGYGHRYYITCGNCGKRVTYLLSRFTKVDGRHAIQSGCRECFKANYLSQQHTKNDVDYNYFKIRQIGRKLDPNFKVDDYFTYPICPFKPKYMKQVTYDKLRKEFNYHVNEALRKHHRMLGIIQKRHARYT